MSWQLTRYIALFFSRWFAICLSVFGGLIFLIELMELSRRAGDKAEVTTGILVRMALFKMPGMVETFLPFICFFGGLMAYWRLQKSSELVSMRSLGAGGGQLYFPACLASLMYGLIMLFMINPINATLKERHNQLDQRYLQSRGPVFSLTENGIWLRQSSSSGSIILKADRLHLVNKDLYGVSIFFYDEEGHFTKRIDASHSVVQDKYLRLFKGWEVPIGSLPKHFQTLSLPLSISLDHLKQSLKPPETLSFWEIPKFLKVLDHTGLASVGYRLHWYRLLAGPLWLCALVLLSLALFLSSPRESKVFIRFAGGVLLGFALFFFKDIAQGLALNNTIPLFLGIGGPILLSLCLSTALLLQAEGH